MLRRGNPPYLECSSKGDTRFSAFFARPKSLNGRTIEQAYQAAKIFDDGATGVTVKAAKGRKAVNQEECAMKYTQWWKEWIEQENLLPILQASTGLSDIFGQAGHVCQAVVLWDIRNGVIR